MSSLERTASGRFEAKDAVDLDQLRGMSREQAAELMVTADFPLIHFGQVTVDSQAAKSFTAGRHLSMKECIVEKEPEFRDKSPDYIYTGPNTDEPITFTGDSLRVIFFWSCVLQR